MRIASVTSRRHCGVEPVEAVGRAADFALEPAGEPEVRAAVLGQQLLVRAPVRVERAAMLGVDRERELAQAHRGERIGRVAIDAPARAATASAPPASATISFAPCSGGAP